jgi:electron transfer flavoprotein beta subunit
MGPSQAQRIIKEAYMMGADEGYVFSDIKFAGADVLATSYTLSQGIKAIGKFDLIICGKQTTDGDTAQVGPAIAEHLGISHVTWVREIEEVDEHSIIVEQDMTDSYEVVRLTYPCLITVEKDIVQPRLPSYIKKLETAKKHIHILNFKDFTDGDKKKYGLDGSPTQVERIFPPEINSKQELWQGESKELVNRLYDLLSDKKFIN